MSRVPFSAVADASRSHGFGLWESVWSTLPLELRDPYFHPAYTFAESSRYSEVTACAYLVMHSHGVAIYPFLLRPIGKTGLADSSSPYGYGGVLLYAKDEISRQSILHELDRIRQAFFASKRVVTEFTRFSPTLVNHIYPLAGQVAVQSRTTFSYNTTGDSFCYLNDIGAKARNKLRQAFRHNLQAAVTPLHRADLTEFLRLYTATMERLGASQEYYFPELYYQRLRQLPGTYLVEVSESSVIAASIIMTGGEWVHYHLAASEASAQSMRPNDFLLYSIVRWAHAQGFSQVHWGGGAGGDDDSLARFKAARSNQSHPYFLGRCVINRQVYDELAVSLQSDSSYFPAYRRLHPYKI